MAIEGQNMGGAARSIEQIRREERDPQFADFYETLEPRILAVAGNDSSVVNPVTHELYNVKNIKDAGAVTDEMISESLASWRKKEEASQAAADDPENPRNKGWV